MENVVNGPYIHQLRGLFGLTREELAFNVKLSDTTIKKYEKKEIKNPHRDNINALAAYFNLDADDFLTSTSRLEAVKGLPKLLSQMSKDLRTAKIVGSEIPRETLAVFNVNSPTTSDHCQLPAQMAGMIPTLVFLSKFAKKNRSQVIIDALSAVMLSSALRFNSQVENLPVYYWNRLSAELDELNKSFPVVFIKLEKDLYDFTSASDDERAEMIRSLFFAVANSWSYFEKNETAYKVLETLCSFWQENKLSPDLLFVKYNFGLTCLNFLKWYAENEPNKPCSMNC